MRLTDDFRFRLMSAIRVEDVRNDGSGSVLGGDGAEGGGELVGAGGGFVAAADSFEPGNDVGGAHPADEGAYALKVSVTAADEANSGYEAIFNLNLYEARAGALCSVLIFHDLNNLGFRVDIKYFPIPQR